MWTLIMLDRLAQLTFTLSNTKAEIQFSIVIMQKSTKLSKLEMCNIFSLEKVEIERRTLLFFFYKFKLSKRGISYVLAENSIFYKKVQYEGSRVTSVQTLRKIIIFVLKRNIFIRHIKINFDQNVSEYIIHRRISGCKYFVFN